MLAVFLQQDENGTLACHVGALFHFLVPKQQLPWACWSLLSTQERPCACLSTGGLG